MHSVGEERDRYGRVSDGFSRRLEGIPDGQWNVATLCPDWTVRDLVAHVIGVHGRVAATVGGLSPPDLGPHGDLAPQWQSATAAVAGALEDPARAGTRVRGMFGEQPFETLVGGLVCADTLFHTWDLARATGQDERLDTEAMAAALRFLEPLDDAIRVPGGFGPKLDTPPGADEQVRFLAFGGRSG